MDDRELIAKVLAGERDAFHALLRRHNGPILASLRASLRDREDAREVLQETWLRAYEQLGSLREPARLRGWLLSIALNLARAHARRSRRGREPWSAAHEPAAPGTDRDVLEHAESLDALRARMAELPERQREVLDLRLNHELSHAEIAALLGITEEASRASFYQALKRLRDALAGAGGAGEAESG